jgi:hypothetical protein
LAPEKGAKFKLRHYPDFICQASSGDPERPDPPMHTTGSLFTISRFAGKEIKDLVI